MTDEPETDKGVEHVAGVPAKRNQTTTFKKLDDVIRRR
jgi:hypothetical protein